MKAIGRPLAWKFALLAGFVAQLLLILFVTAIGLKQLAATKDNLDQVVDVHMRKQNLTKSMVIAARERTMIMLMLPRIDDPFELDALLMQFNRNGSKFVLARDALRELPLNAREQELIELQGQRTRVAQPIQDQVIDLFSANFSQDAVNLVLNQAIPAQDGVMAVLSQLDIEL